MRSTLAAEPTALSKSLDRQLYQRLMVESLIYGQTELRDTDWRVHLRVPGILVTDAKSLYDHLQEDGSLPAERQTLLDVLVAKDLVEQKCIDIRWFANSHSLQTSSRSQRLSPRSCRPSFEMACSRWCRRRPRGTTRLIAWSYVVARGCEPRKGRRPERVLEK